MSKNTFRHKLTKSYIDSIQFLEVGQVFYRDTEIFGFALRVGKTAKTYIAENKVNGKTVRFTIGKHGVVTAEQARIQARKILGQMASGNNPVEDKKALRAKTVMLEEVLAEFLAARKSLKPRTIADYQDVLKRYLSDWLDKPMAEITKEMVAKRHTLIGEKSPAQANLSMRYLRALFNFAIYKYEDAQGIATIAENPVKRLTQTRAWYRIKRRMSVIRAHDLDAWHQSLSNLKNDHTSNGREAFRDFLLLILFTGLRREEAASLLWKNIDLKAKILTIEDTKNHQDHNLPLTDFICDMLTNRRMLSLSQYVFPRDSGTGYILLPQKLMKRVATESGVAFSVHDLRRTFITIAESLDIPAYALKRLLNHKMNNDVTAGYIITDVERLRPPMQKITDYILKCIGLIESAPVIPLQLNKVG